MKILFLAANPKGTARLALDKEFRKIKDGLQRSKLNTQFQLVSEWAVDSDALRRALLHEKPDVVHFSGHGEGKSGLVLVGQNGQSKPATSEALSGLFKYFPSIKCVLLNACYAEMQAKAIVQHIDCVIGMKQAVRDDAAIAFATGFYDGLGYGMSIDDAFELGCNAVQFETEDSSPTRSRKVIPVGLISASSEKVESLPEHLIPVLLKRDGSSTNSLTSFPSSSSKTNLLSEKLRKREVSEADAFRIYRERVQEFLADLKLTQIERFQLAILANVLGISEVDANQILQQEQKKHPYSDQLMINGLLGFKLNHTKKYFLGCLALLIVSTGGFITYKQTTNPYAHLQTLLKEENWKASDYETARIMWKIAGRQQEESLRVEDFSKLSCSDLRRIDNIWRKYSKNRFGFSAQKRIWLSDKVNGDLAEFSIRTGWGFRNEEGKFFYLVMDEGPIELSDPEGKLPWAVTYYGGDNDTRNSYMSRLISCLP